MLKEYAKVVCRRTSPCAGIFCRDTRLLINHFKTLWLIAARPPPVADCSCRKTQRRMPGQPWRIARRPIARSAAGVAASRQPGQPEAGGAQQPAQAGVDTALIVVAEMHALSVERRIV